MDHCLFCKIAKKEVKSNTVYEDKDFIAFLDIGPVNKGHTLVMPKKHYQTFLDLPKKELSNINLVCQKIAAGILKATKAEAFNIIVNNKSAAGQEIHHLHFHIIPRFENDGHKFINVHKKYESGESEAIAARIKSLL